MSDVTLLPCPFCGGEAFVFRKREVCCKDENCAGWTVNRCSIEQWNRRAALTPATDGRAEGLREAAAWHEAQITELDEQIARNDRYRKETGRLGQVSEANEYCRTLIANHRLSRDAILARAAELP